MAKTAEKIQDFGDTIAGSKKALWRTRGFSIEDLTDMSEKEILTSVKKQVVWKEPNYVEMFNEGCYREDLYFLKLCYNAIGATIPVYLEQSAKESADCFTEFLQSFSNYILLLVRKHTLMYEESVLSYLQKYGYLEQGKYRWNYTEKAKYNPAFSKTFDTFLNMCISGIIPKECDRLELRNVLINAQGENEDSIKNRINVLQYTRLSKHNIFADCYCTGFPLNYNHSLVGIHWITGKATDGAKMYYVYTGSKTNRLRIEYPAYIEEDSTTHNNKTITRLIADGTITKDFTTAVVKLKEKKQAQKETLVERAGLSNVPKEVTRIALANTYVLRKAPRLRKGNAQIASLLYDENNENKQACFNFRGGEFGNWQNKRQECLNCAVDAFSDLACITNLPFEAMSVCFTGERNHRLTIAWGSRGGGHASAHYEPDTTVINLTKYRGAGTLAHEWGHALDHALGRWCMRNIVQQGTKNVQDTFITKLSAIRNYENVEQQLITMFNTLITVMTKKEVQITDNERAIRIQSAIRSTSDAIKDKLVPVVTRLRHWTVSLDRTGDFIHIKALVDKVVTGELLIADFVTKVTEFGYDPAIKGEVYNFIVQQQKYLRDNSKFDIVETKTINTNYYTDACYFDSLRTKSYYSTETELFARAFEAYVEDSLSEQQMCSEYLVHGTNSKVYAAMYDGHNPYPCGEERKLINTEIRKILDFVSKYVVCGCFDVKYRKYYTSTQYSTDKYFETNSSETEKDILNTQIAVANENVKYAQGAMEACRVSHIDATAFAEGIQEMCTDISKLTALNVEIPVINTRIDCIITNYNSSLNLVTIRSAGDLRSLRMHLDLINNLITLDLINIIKGKELLPLESVAVRVPAFN